MLIVCRHKHIFRFMCICLYLFMLILCRTVLVKTYASEYVCTRMEWVRSVASTGKYLQISIGRYMPNERGGQVYVNAGIDVFTRVKIYTGGWGCGCRFGSEHEFT